MIQEPQTPQQTPQHHPPFRPQQQHQRAHAADAAAAATTTTTAALYRAGQRVPPGLYRQVEGSTRRQIRLTREDYLPASLDGRVALYERVRAWGEAAASFDTCCGTCRRRA